MIDFIKYLFLIGFSFSIFPYVYSLAQRRNKLAEILNKDIQTFVKTETEVEIAELHSRMKFSFQEK